MRGGKREGAGRKPGPTKQPELLRETINVRLPRYQLGWLRDQPESAGKLISKALDEAYRIPAPKE